MYSFFPNIHKDIDFSKGYEFLEKELQKIIKTSKTGRRYADKLVKVFLKNGSERWLLIHIEIQGYKEKKFPERMYTYNYRIFENPGNGRRCSSKIRLEEAFSDGALQARNESKKISGHLQVY